MIEEHLEKLKKEYIKTETTSYLENYGWTNLRSRLDESPAPTPVFKPTLAKGIAFAVLLIIAGFGFLGFTQKSKPGQALYPVKILSDKVYSQVTGDYEASINKRAQEVIEQSAKPNGGFEEATKQYQKAIEDARDKREKSDEQKKEEFRRTLEEQEKKFRETLKQNPSHQSQLEEVEEYTKRTRGEVKGKRDERPSDNNNQNNNSN